MVLLHPAVFFLFAAGNKISMKPKTEILCVWWRHLCMDVCCKKRNRTSKLSLLEIFAFHVQQHTTEPFQQTASNLAKKRTAAGLYIYGLFWTRTQTHTQHTTNPHRAIIKLRLRASFYRPSHRRAGLFLVGPLGLLLRLLGLGVPHYGAAEPAISRAKLDVVVGRGRQEILPHGGGRGATCAL